MSKIVVCVRVRERDRDRQTDRCIRVLLRLNFVVVLAPNVEAKRPSTRLSWGECLGKGGGSGAGGFGGWMWEKKESDAKWRLTRTGTPIGLER